MYHLAGARSSTTSPFSTMGGLEKKNRVINPKEKQIVAFHETGHALVATYTPGSDAVHKISIVPRGIGALGWTQQLPTEDRYLMGSRGNSSSLRWSSRAGRASRMDLTSAWASSRISGSGSWASSWFSSRSRLSCLCSR